MDLSQYYTIRVDSNDDVTRESICQFMEKEQFPEYLIYHEISEDVKKSHYQGVIKVLDNSDSAIKKLRDHVRYAFSTKKSSFSLAKVKKEEYFSYITKDGDKVCSKGFTQEQIEDFHSKSYKKEKVNNKSYMQKYIDYMELTYENKGSLFVYDGVVTTHDDIDDEDVVEYIYTSTRYNKFLLNVKRDVVKETLQYMGANIRTIDSRIINQFAMAFINKKLCKDEHYLRFIADKLCVDFF